MSRTTIIEPLDLTARHVTVNGTVQIEWSNDNHVSEFTPEWLHANACERSEIALRRPTRQLWDAGTFATLPKPFALPCLASDKSYLRERLAQVRDAGFVLLSDIPVESGSLFSVIDLFGYVRETNYGSYFIDHHPNEFAWGSGGHPLQQPLHADPGAGARKAARFLRGFPCICPRVGR